MSSWDSQVAAPPLILEATTLQVVWISSLDQQPHKSFFPSLFSSVLCSLLVSLFHVRCNLSLVCFYLFLYVIPLIISAYLLYSCCSWFVFVLVSFYMRNLVVFKFFYMGFVPLLIPFGKLVVGCIIFFSWYCFVLFELFLNCYWVLLAVLEVTHPFYVHFLHYKS